MLLEGSPVGRRRGDQESEVGQESQVTALFFDTRKVPSCSLPFVLPPLVS